eukprot:TRINITY_DN10912_c0_g1_i3.p1 TRINITY_DN10912_c0_g1~~TRINITY_DN10912_c0_g1_i3.p1  ORF type:complete len:970 (+),score=304.84 TRINITY_DN10912_c0_g1_i3:166-3075(+)
MMKSLKGKLNRVRGNRKRSSHGTQDNLSMHDLAYLQALRCDLAAWFNVVLSRSDIEGTSFVNSLQSGVLLCSVARVIESTHTKWALTHQIPWKPSRVKCNEKATPGSFFARDNILSFLNWCAKFGGSAMLFDCDDLVEGRNEEAVLHCLHALARSQRGVIAPILIRAEEAVNGNSSETLLDVLADLPNLNEPICSAVRAAGWDPEAVVIEPDDSGMYYLGTDAQPCCVALAGGLAMIKVGPVQWTTLTRYILEAWGTPSGTSPTPAFEAESPKSPSKARKAKRLIDTFNGLARKRSNTQLRKRSGSGSFKLQRRASSRDNSARDLLKKQRPSSEIIVRSEYSFGTETVEEDIPEMDAAAMSQLINACVEHESEEEDNSSADIEIDPMQAAAVNDKHVDQAYGDEEDDDDLPDDFDPLAEVDDDFDPLAEVEQDDKWQAPPQNRPAPPPTPPAHTKPALVRTLGSDHEEAADEDMTHDAETDHDTEGEEDEEDEEEEAIAYFDDDEEDSLNTTAPPAIAPTTINTTASPSPMRQPVPDRTLRRASHVDAQPDTDLPLPRHLRKEGSTTTGLSARVLSRSNEASPRTSRQGSLDRLDTGRRTSVDVSNLGKSLPLPKKLRKASLVPLETGDMSRGVSTIGVIAEQPDKPDKTTKPALELKNEGVRDYYGNRQPPAKPAKPLKPALIGRSLTHDPSAPAASISTPTLANSAPPVPARKPPSPKPATAAKPALLTKPTARRESHPEVAHSRPAETATPVRTKSISPVVPRRVPRRKSSGASAIRSFISTEVVVNEGQDMQKLMAELEQQKQEMEALKKENASLHARTQELESAACQVEQMADKQVAELEAKLALSKETTSELEEQLQSYQLEVVALKEKELVAKVAMDDCAELKRQVQQLKKEQAMAENKHSQRLTGVSKELHALKTDNERLQAELKKAHDRKADAAASFVVLELPNYGPVRVALTLEETTSL